MSHIDRKSLKRPDTFQREARHAGQILRERWPLALGAVVLLVVLVAGGAWWQNRSADRQAEAAAAVAAAVARYEGTDPTSFSAGTPTADSARAALPALRELAATYQGTDAGATAQLYVAHALLKTGDARAAAQAYQAALAVAPNDLARAAARLGLGHAELSQGNPAAAIDAWKPLAEGDGPLRAMALLDLGRAYEAAGKTEEARKAYADGTAVLKGDRRAATGRTAQLAEERLAALGGAPAAAGASPAAK